MKTLPTTRYLFVFLMFILLFSTGCCEQIQPNSTEQTTLIPSLKTDIAPSERLVPTETPTPRPLPTNTVTMPPLLTITSTLQAMATLDPTQYAETVQKYLSQGEVCQSPCIFGIIPGQTPMDQAGNIFSSLRHPLTKNTYPDGKEFYQAIIGCEEKNISISVDLSEENGVMKNMKAGIKLPEYKKNPEPRVWQAFSPETILAKYGLPSQIEFRLSFPTEEGFPRKTAWYDMVLLYDHLDLTVEYLQGLTVEDDLIQVCPLSDQYSSVSVYIGMDFEYPPYTGVPLEKATSLTLAQFSDLLNQRSKTACFDISKDAFYPKE